LAFISFFIGRGKLFRKILFLGLGCLCAFSLFSYNVNINELNKAGKLEFINDTRPSEKKESVFEVQWIGVRLARGAESNKVFRYFQKYSIIHAVSREEYGKLSADIFSVDRDARVDHIKNIRRILAAYLEARYGYDNEQARLLAIIITYYNAYYRGKWDYISKHYKSTVLKYLHWDNAGIALHFRDWPGKTRILIPLTEEKQERKIDLSELGKEEIREKLEEQKQDVKAYQAIVEFMKEEKKASEQRGDNKEPNTRETGEEKDIAGEKDGEVLKEAAPTEKQKEKNEREENLKKTNGKEALSIDDESEDPNQKEAGKKAESPSENKKTEAEQKQSLKQKKNGVKEGENNAEKKQDLSEVKKENTGEPGDKEKDKKNETQKEQPEQGATHSGEKEPQVSGKKLKSTGEGSSDKPIENRRTEKAEMTSGGKKEESKDRREKGDNERNVSKKKSEGSVREEIKKNTAKKRDAGPETVEKKKEKKSPRENTFKNQDEGKKSETPAKEKKPEQSAKKDTGINRKEKKSEKPEEKVKHSEDGTKPTGEEDTRISEETEKEKAEPRDNRKMNKEPAGGEKEGQVREAGNEELRKKEPLRDKKEAVKKAVPEREKKAEPTVGSKKRQSERGKNKSEEKREKVEKTAVPGEHEKKETGFREERDKKPEKVFSIEKREFVFQQVEEKVQISVPVYKTGTGRTYVYFQKAVLGVGRTKGEKYHLVLLEKESLEPLFFSRMEVDPESPFWTRNSNLYILIKINGQKYLGKFNQNLGLTARSPSSFETGIEAFQIRNGKIVLSLKNGEKRIFDAESLVEK
jgi:hypothetical protein